MRRNATTLSAGVVCLLLPLSAGCYQSTGLRVLNFLGLEREPVVLALVAESRAPGAPNLLEVINPYAPYEPLQQALAKEIGRPVALELCFPLQLEPSLRTGMYDLAIISPAQYARFAGDKLPPVLAVATDAGGTLARPGLLIAPSAGGAARVADLKGKMVAFGPAEDSRTHYAALQLLARHGVRREDLSLELLPLPGSLRHLPDCKSVVQAVQSGAAAAGFVDEAAWRDLPASGKAGEASQAGLRVLDKTIDLPDRLVVASAALDSEAAEKARRFLLAAREKAPKVLKPLRVAGYSEPHKTLLEACRELSPGPMEPPTEDAAAAEAPQ